MTTVYVWTVNLLVFISELLMLGVLGYTGWRLSGEHVIGWVVGIVAVLAAATLWGLFASPRATFDVPAMMWIVKIGLFAGATALLALADARPSLVIGFAAFSILINLLASFPPVSTTSLGPAAS